MRANLIDLPGSDSGTPCFMNGFRIGAPHRRIRGLAWLAGIGWNVAHRPDIGPDAPVAEQEYGLDHSALDRQGRTWIDISPSAHPDRLKAVPLSTTSRPGASRTRKRFVQDRSKILTLPDGFSRRVFREKLYDSVEARCRRNRKGG